MPDSNLELSNILCPCDVWERKHCTVCFVLYLWYTGEKDVDVILVQLTIRLWQIVVYARRQG
jgi:hypothetical protein